MFNRQINEIHYFFKTCLSSFRRFFYKSFYFDLYSHMKITFFLVCPYGDILYQSFTSDLPVYVIFKRIDSIFLKLHLTQKVYHDASKTWNQPEKKSFKNLNGISIFDIAFSCWMEKWILHLYSCYDRFFYIIFFETLLTSYSRIQKVRKMLSNILFFYKDSTEVLLRVHSENEMLNYKIIYKMAIIKLRVLRVFSSTI